MAFYIIRTIARYEMRTLLRSWFFRIFAGMSIMGLGLFNAGLNFPGSGSPWIYRAIAASIPYANLIILNLGQAIVAVFLASEFLKQDRKNDTMEVIYVRSMSNGEYIFGKTLGILSVFLILNLIILALGVGFSFISNAGSQRIFPYLAYPLLISLPTLVYILGLSFFIMVLIKNQAVTFILLLGYIALTIFYLNKKAFHIFDFIAYQVPMMYSSISGFGNLAEILLHRFIYFLLGAGLIFLTTYKLNRLPQSPRLARLPLYFGLFFLFAGSYCIYQYLQIKLESRTFRQETLAQNNRYALYPRVMVRSCKLDVKHLATKITVDARLMVYNYSKHRADTLIFSLNSGLILKNVMINNEKVQFKRIMQIIRVESKKPLSPGDSLEIDMQYAGNINENGCYPDKDPLSFDDNFKIQVFTLRKRFAFLQRNFVCLTRESQWYPVSGTGYASTVPFRYEPDFTKYELTVRTSPGLTAISQGKENEPEKGIFTFKPEYPLPAIGLVIGNYRKFSVKVDSVEYSLYSIRGHEYYEPIFTEIADTIPALIRGLKQEYEVSLGLKYPFKRFILAEVPVHFALDNAIYDYASDAVQPEMVLYPEKGLVFNTSDFKTRQYWRERDLKNNNEEVLPEEIKSTLFKDFVKNSFMEKEGNYFDRNLNINDRSFSLFPQYLSFVTRLQSEQWPVLNTAFEAYVSERNNDAGTVLQWYEDLSRPEKINIELGQASLSDLLKKGIISSGNNSEDVNLHEIVVAKGNEYFNLLRARLGESDVDTIVTRLINSHQHQFIAFEELDSIFQSRFKTNLVDETNRWYNQKRLPGFIIKDLATYKVREGEATRYQIKFLLTNAENADGLVTLNIELNDPNRRDEEWNNDNFKIDYSKKIFVPGSSSFEIGILFNTEPARMSMVTHISKNLPYNLLINFPGFTETRNVHAVDGIHGIAYTDTREAKGEVIIDNEDKGFSEHQATSQAYLKSIVKTANNNRYKYSSIHSWNPPREWKAVLRSEFYGRYVHSASYTRAGTGERSAAWVAKLPEKASYDVYFYLDKLNGVWRRSNKSPDYNFLIYHDQGIEKIKKSSVDAEDGWNYLGTFSFSSDSARVEMNNKTLGDMIIADAVKWVLSK
jgi:ABC-type transport system involved in multi-copper enzyme maturation permease subunit